MTAQQTWKTLITQARNGRKRKEKNNQTYTELVGVTYEIDFLEYEALLEDVRGLGWLYPSNQELRSILLEEKDVREYSYGVQVSESLTRAVEKLRDHEHTRRAVIPLFGNSQTAHLPSLMYAQFSIEDSVVDCSVHARSVDLLFGLPANVFQAGVLLDTVADSLGLKQGKIRLIMDSAHVFDEYAEVLETLLKE